MFSKIKQFFGKKKSKPRRKLNLSRSKESSSWRWHPRRQIAASRLRGFDRKYSCCRRGYCIEINEFYYVSCFFIIYVYVCVCMLEFVLKIWTFSLLLLIIFPHNDTYFF